jgi:hypothetical protein
MQALKFEPPPEVELGVADPLALLLLLVLVLGAPVCAPVPGAWAQLASSSAPAPTRADSARIDFLTYLPPPCQSFLRPGSLVTRQSAPSRAFRNSIETPAAWPGVRAIWP